MNNNALDAGIPLLTEVIDGLENDTIYDEANSDIWSRNRIDRLNPSSKAAIHSALERNEMSQPAVTLPRDTTTFSNSDWEKLAQELHERILRQLQDRIDIVIEQRVRDSLNAVLQTAVQGLADQIKMCVHTTLNDVISSAVATEIYNFQKTK